VRPDVTGLPLMRVGRPLPTTARRRPAQSASDPVRQRLHWLRGASRRLARPRPTPIRTRHRPPRRRQPPRARSRTHARTARPAFTQFRTGGRQARPPEGTAGGPAAPSSRAAGCLHRSSGAGGALDADEAFQPHPRRGQPGICLPRQSHHQHDPRATHHCPRPACPLSPTAELAPADRLALAKPVGAARDHGEQPTPRGPSHPRHSKGPTGTTSRRPAGPPSDRHLPSHDEPQDHFTRMIIQERAVDPG